MKKPALVFVLLASSALVLPGCATVRSEAAAKIKDADEKTVTGCTYVGDVRGTSNLGASLAAEGIKDSQAFAAEEAVRLKATHIVWAPVQAGAWGVIANGRAYRCPAP